MFEFLLEPFIDTYFFGCPDSCIVPNGDTHQMLKILFTPLVVLVVGIGAIIGTLAVLGRLPNLESLRSLRRKSVTEDILASPEAEVVYPPKEPKTIKQFERAIKKEHRNDFLSKLDEMESNPEIAFSKFLELQEDHPLTESLEVVRTEAKEITPDVKMTTEKEQEFYTDNKQELEKQAKQITELMKSENITEEEAIDRIIKEMPTEVEVEDVVPTEVEVEGKKQDLFSSICEDDDQIKCDVDLFKLDEEPKVYPKYLRFWHNQFKKKEKPKIEYKLTDLGKLRRDQYAEQIEIKMKDWALPMPKYEGKNQEYQMEEGLLKSELKKLALFISMCEMMVDKRKTKKKYWKTTRIV